ncbi:VOC family protein [Bacillus sp. Marseille-Q3570]|uniref:VOC family protein n=1 Tax=Bacillus sp. Marseille-Q3570 TaxID=2963522 RepID=UPI0021B82195|nr:VOC family protein [Bacillus sp. Marseille-Q3570]
MNRVVHFEIQVAEPEKSAAFFKNVFGWKVEKWDGPDEYWLVQTGEGSDGIDGGLMKSPDGETRTINVIHVQSVDEFSSKIEAEGGKIVVPKMPIPGVGYVAYANDVNGYLFGYMHDDPEAK